MTETRVMIETGEHLLEGLFARGEIPSAGGMLCHPHPLYGGSMHNEIVSTMQRRLREWGWSTLRFNFRGVGASGGEYGEGKGEAEDVRAVAAYLFQEGIRDLHLAGYSFGSWVALKALAADLQPASLILVSPPVDFLRFADLQLPSCPCLITVGELDDFCAPESLQAWLSTQKTKTEPAEIEILEGCDHFYWGNETKLSAKISDFLNRHFKIDVA